MTTSIKTNTWLNVRLGRYKWYRKVKGGKWHLHKFTKDASELTFSENQTFWAQYGKINRYSDVIRTEEY